MRLAMFFCLLSVGFYSNGSSIDVFEFSSDQNRDSYQALTRELRCPKCQNQDIADSNAPIAKDMRVQVHRLVEEGKTKNEVIDFMIERFGDFVSYKPKVAAETYLLWYGPWIFIVIGGMVIVMIAWRKGKSSGSRNDAQASTGEERKKVEELLNQYSDD